MRANRKIRPIADAITASVATQGEKQTELKEKLSEMANVIKADYDWTDNKRKGNTDELKASIESFKAKNEQKRAERKDRFEERVAEKKKSLEERSAKLKERLDGLREKEFAPPASSAGEIFERAA